MPVLERLRRFRRAAVWLVIAMLALGLCALDARAQLVSGQDRAPLIAEQDQLFQRMLREPANLDVAFAYAAVSAKLGDNEAAASALERMLLFNPTLPRIDLELGSLYFRMGSFDLARDYFNKALAANAPPDVRVRASRYLEESAAQQSPSPFQGYGSFGPEYQTDAHVVAGL